MRQFHRSLIFIILLVGMNATVNSQSTERKGWLSSRISLEQLRKTVTIEDLIYDLPKDYKVASFHFGMASKIKKINCEPFTFEEILKDSFQCVEAGNTLLFEYVQIKRKGSNDKPVRILPHELIVFE